MKTVEKELDLLAADRKSLLALLKRKRQKPQDVLHAKILLGLDVNSDKPMTPTQVAAAYKTSVRTVITVKNNYLAGGLEQSLYRKKRLTPPVEPKITGDIEARLIRLACSAPPDGRCRWTLQLLADESVRLEIVDSISNSTVYRILKKNELKPHLKKCYCIPPEQNGQFVARMEKVLNAYTREYNPEIPLICMDEKPYQLLDDAREPIPMEVGEPLKYDSEYVRKGTSNIFLFTEPLGGWRHVDPTERRTKVDWAYQIHDLVYVHYPEAKKIVLIMDNLNTHDIGSLYEAFSPEIAGDITDRLEIIYTPKHGSWLNIAEIELSVLTQQCLDRRIGTMEQLKKETAAWEQARNTSQKGVDWQFTTADARTRLKRLYPVPLMKI